MIKSDIFKEISDDSKYSIWREVPYLQETRLSVGKVGHYFYNLSDSGKHVKFTGSLKNTVNSAIHGDLDSTSKVNSSASAQRLHLTKSKLTNNKPRLCGTINFIKTNKRNESTCHWSR